MINLDHFTLAEFFCPCCGAVAMDDRFLGMLDAARDGRRAVRSDLGIPLRQP